MPQLTIYFQKPADWADTVHVHYWDAQPGSRASGWPGVAMVAEDDGWFVHRFDGVRAAHLLFNDNQGYQTSDLQRDRDGFYLHDQWHDQRPDVSVALAAPRPAPRAPRPASLTPSGKDFREETIYFLLTARFYEGDPSISFFCRDRIKFNRQIGQLEDPHWCGDFKGLI